MKSVTNKWIEISQRNLKDAEILFKNKSYQGAAWHCHQAIEKILKAIIIEKGKRVPKVHDLVDLIEETKLKIPEALVQVIEELNFHYLPPRYPDVVPQLNKIYQRRNIHQLLKQTKELFKWLRIQLNQSR